MKQQLLLAQYELQSAWLLQRIESISEEQSHLRPTEKGNSIKWLTGHILNSRMIIHSLITGQVVQSPYASLFGKGSTGELPSDAPTMTELIGAWKQLTAKFSNDLSALSEEKLATAPPFQTSIPDQTFAGLIAYFAVHESFHIGQLSQIIAATSN